MDGLDDVLLRLVEGRYDSEKMKKTRGQQAALLASLQQGDDPAALKTIDEMIQSDERNLELYQMKAGLLLQGEDPDALAALFEKMLETFKDSSGELNDIAWMMVAPSPLPLPRRNLRLAYSAALRAADLTGRQDPAILDTLAMVYYAAGLPEKAVETQTRALELSKDPEQRKSLSALLGYYQSVLKTREEIRAAGEEPAK
jgi:tetratricopeptide (TPR) repeat protein